MLTAKNEIVAIKRNSTNNFGNKIQYRSKNNLSDIENKRTKCK